MSARVESPPIGGVTLGGSFVIAVVVALSIGVWTRRPWAWRCGFVLLGLSVCWPLFALRARGGIDLPAGMIVIFAVFSCTVAGIWGHWWYAPRKNFRWS